MNTEVIGRRLALGLALVALAVPAAAHGATPGVITTGAPTDEGVIAAAETGAKITRQFVIWRDAEGAGKGQYDTDYAAEMEAAVAAAAGRGMKLLWTIIEAPQWANGTTDPAVPPRDPADYGDFVAWVAERASAHPEALAAVNIWNEPDANVYFHGATTVIENDRATTAARAREYAPLVQAAYPRVKAALPGTQVLVGGLTGGNWQFVEELYAAGLRGSFDGVAVNPDFACLTDPPDRFYRMGENGRLGQITFLSYREVRQTLLANGEDKPVWLSAMGWSSTQSDGHQPVCERGNSAGRKPSGVSETQQSLNLTKAYQCVANDPWVPYAIWFNLQDTPGQFTPDEFNHYGLRRADGSGKPAWSAFLDAVRNDGYGPGSGCGDFEPPAITVVSPAPGQRFVDKIDVQAHATDTGVGLARISFSYDGGNEIRNYTDALANGQTVGLTPWQGSGALGLGAHTITVRAVDANLNAASVDVPVEKVAAGALPATFAPKLKLAKKVRCKRRRCSYSGRLLRGAAGRPSIGGKVAIEWQWRNREGKYRKLAGGLKPASRPFTFRATLRRAGRWRVRVIYRGQAPWKLVRSKFVYFRVR